MKQTTVGADFLRLKKNLKRDFSQLTLYKLAILGDSSTQLLHQAIRGYGFEVGINFEIYESDYGQIEQEVFDTTSGLYQFKPDTILVLQSSQKLLSAFYQCVEDKRSEFAKAQISKIENLFETISTRFTSKIIYSNFVEVDDRVFGNFSNKITSSFIFQLRKLNFEVMNLAVKHKNVFINDISNLNNREGFNTSFDSKLYINGDFVFSLDFTAKVASNIADIILSLLGRSKKCLILDLDNTLWGGIIGDDGIENIEIGDLGIGKAFTKFQEWIKQLKMRGILLAVCSKNTEHIAKEPFKKHPDMVLRLDDIAIFVANWESKADNIRYIQSVLNIGFDSMVFIDDNPFERGLVRQEIPELEVPEMSDDPTQYLEFLKSLNLFETLSLTEEDSSRTKQYQEEAKRVEFQKSVGSETAYLESLNMTSVIKPFDRFNTPRVAQLSQRSNQFNLRTVRYIEEDLSRIADSKEYITASFDLKDRFGDNGLIAALILKFKHDALFIDTWIMSCRVLKRGMEQFIINEVVKIAKLKNVARVVGEYLPTKKNGIVKDLYSSLNFSFENGLWILDVANFTPYKIYINATD